MAWLPKTIMLAAIIIVIITPWTIAKTKVANITKPVKIFFVSYISFLCPTLSPSVWLIVLFDSSSCAAHMGKALLTKARDCFNDSYRVPVVCSN
jgi:chromate transport protein ChrA